MLLLFFLKTGNIFELFIRGNENHSRRSIAGWICRESFFLLPNNVFLYRFEFVLPLVQRCINGS